MSNQELKIRCQRCGAQMEMRDPEPGGAWKPDQFWVCNSCGRHFWTTYAAAPKPAAEAGAAAPKPAAAAATASPKPVAVPAKPAATPDAAPATPEPAPATTANS